MIRFVFGPVALLAIAASVAEAVQVTAKLNRSQVYVGDMAVLSVMVEGTIEKEVSPVLPNVPGLSIDPQPHINRQSVSINGRESVTTILSYGISPSRKGTFTIPSFVVQVGNETYRTEPLVLTVGEPPQDEGLLLKASVSKEECFPQEPVTVIYKLYFSKVIREYRYRIPLLDQAEELSIESFVPEGRKKGEITAGNFKLTAAVSDEKLEGTSYKVFSLFFRIYPPKEGILELQPASIKAEVEEGFRRERDFFGFVRRVSDYKTVIALSEALRLRVKPIPEEGRPPEYYGLVGDYSIEVEADRTRVKVGDPINLTIRIKGEGRLKNVERPRLSKLEAFKEFKIEENLAPGEIQGDSVVFDQRIRAGNEGIKEIPSVILPFFDVQSGTYKVARSRPLPLEVLPTRQVTAADIEGREGGGKPFVEKREIQEKAGGINANYFYLDALSNQRLSVSLLLLALASPVAYFILLGIVRYYRKIASDPALLRQRGAWKKARGRLAEARSQMEGEARTFFDLLSRSLGGFMEDRYNLGEGEFTLVDLDALVRDQRISSELAGEARNVLDQCDAGRFGSSLLSTEERHRLVKRTEDLIKNLERS